MILRCECGGVLKRTTLKEYVFTAYAGIASALRNTPGLQCNKCHLTTLDGMVINAALTQIALRIVKQPERMTADHARYLRRHMRLAPKELAQRLGFASATVDESETGKIAVSAQYDFILRALLVAQLVRRSKSTLARKEVMSVLESVRPERRGSGDDPCVLDFSRGVRGRYAHMFDKGYTITVHHEDHDEVTVVPPRS